MAAPDVILPDVILPDVILPDVILNECFARDGLQNEPDFVATDTKVALIDPDLNRAVSLPKGMLPHLFIGIGNPKKPNVATSNLSGELGTKNGTASITIRCGSDPIFAGKSLPGI